MLAFLKDKLHVDPTTPALSFSQYYDLQLGMEIASTPNPIELHHKEEIFTDPDSGEEYFHVLVGGPGSTYNFRYYFRDGYRFKVYSGDKLLFISNRYSDVLKNYIP